ncbi:hypothetical protein AB1Y20_005732 [Prymnesium parvum]|uniref:Glycosyltransferase subfamily 4-like N-terminal domain-containing protein n=1 Tax=Prymnesium parvum TaxID=97485 RepID=A0AB34J214_PRYPA
MAAPCGEAPTAPPLPYTPPCSSERRLLCRRTFSEPLSLHRLDAYLPPPREPSPLVASLRPAEPFEGLPTPHARPRHPHAACATAPRRRAALAAAAAAALALLALSLWLSLRHAEPPLERVLLPAAALEPYERGLAAAAAAALGGPPRNGSRAVGNASRVCFVGRVARGVPREEGGALLLRLARHGARLGLRARVLLLPTRAGQCSPLHAALRPASVECLHDGRTASPLAALRAYSVLRWLDRPASSPAACDVAHFVDAAAEAYYALLAQRQRLALLRTTIALHVHSPLEWRLRRDGTPLSSPGLAAALFMEREAISLAPHLLVATPYMSRWLATRFPLRHGHTTLAPLPPSATKCASLFRPRLSPLPSASRLALLLAVDWRSPPEVALVCNALTLLHRTAAADGWGGAAARLELHFASRRASPGPRASAAHFDGQRAMASHARKHSWTLPYHMRPVDEAWTSAYRSLGDAGRTLLLVLPALSASVPSDVMLAAACELPLLALHTAATPWVLDASSRQQLLPPDAAAIASRLWLVLASRREAEPSLRLDGAAPHAAAAASDWWARWYASPPLPPPAAAAAAAAAAASPPPPPAVAVALLLCARRRRGAMRAIRAAEAAARAAEARAWVVQRLLLPPPPPRAAACAGAGGGGGAALPFGSEGPLAAWREVRACAPRLGGLLAALARRVAAEWVLLLDARAAMGAGSVLALLGAAEAARADALAPAAAVQMEGGAARRRAEALELPLGGALSSGALRNTLGSVGFVRTAALRRLAGVAATRPFALAPRCTHVVWSLLYLLALSGARVEPVPLVLLNLTRAAHSAGASPPLPRGAPTLAEDSAGEASPARRWDCAPDGGGGGGGPCVEVDALREALARRTASAGLASGGVVLAVGTPPAASHANASASRSGAGEALDMASILMALQGLAHARAEGVRWAS